jgi:hypothetical protein
MNKNEYRSEIRLNLKKKNSKFALLKLILSLGLINSGLTQASDHIDFTGGGANNVVPRELDLTDLFAWVPAPGRLVLGLNTNLAASPLTQFSNSHLYRFRLRKLNLDSSLPESILVPTIKTDSPEITIVCKVNGENAKCSSDNILAEAQLNNENTEDTISKTGARLFAGLRADPFILDITWAGKYTKLTAGTGELPPDSRPSRFRKPVNFSDYLNVLNFTLELDTAKLFGGKADLIAVAADVVTESAVERKIIDRVGRPELTNMTIRADAVKEIYNGVDTFNLPENSKSTFLKFIGAGVLSWDKLDKVTDWSQSNLERFTNTLVNDYLVVDLNESCVKTDEKTGVLNFIDSSYLDIETNRRKVEGGFRSCGGRVPTEDIIDTLVSYYTSGPTASNITFGDGADKVRNSPTSTWPYFAKPFINK